MKKRVFSGARPTGKQHIGNYIGAIQNYVALQKDYDCIYCKVDIHALTTLENTDRLQQDIHEMTLDWLAAGLDPQKSILFVQSHVPEVMELYTLLGMVTPLGWLMRVPTFKEKARMQPQNVNYGLVGYPVVMTAVTDPARKYRADPGHPDVCNVFSLHGFFNPDRVDGIAVECRSAEIGCVDCKKLLAEGINSKLSAFREKREIGRASCRERV